jgi:hypothetical protein
MGRQIAWTWAVAQKLTQAFDFIFGCWHRRLSRPFTLSGWTYEVCLECGKQFPYAGDALRHCIHPWEINAEAAKRSASHANSVSHWRDKISVSEN